MRRPLPPPSKNHSKSCKRVCASAELPTVETILAPSAVSKACQSMDLASNTSSWRMSIIEESCRRNKSC